MQTATDNGQKEEKQPQVKLPIAWSALEYRYVPKGPNWFWFLGSGTLALVITAIFLKNFLLAVFAVIAALAIALQGIRKPKKISISVEEKGVRVESKFYEYEKIKSFWLETERPEKKELVFEFKGKMVRYIKVPLGNANPADLKSALIKLLQEKKYEQPFLETITDILGL
ncbi:MAG: DUF5673 domain-containing protein [Candidatus Pacebacteria bacterium]|nr:DUF5673 domain-containing protein [Candidatus Paceibacterota bacterium]